MSNLNLGSFGDKRNSPKLNADALNHLPKARRDWLEIFDDAKGGHIKVMPGTCEACVWGRGEHAEGCVTRQFSEADLFSRQIDAMMQGFRDARVQSLSLSQAWARQAVDYYRRTGVLR